MNRISKKIKPISPDDVPNKKLESIPDAVIEAFNELIVKNMNRSGESTFKMSDVADLILKKMPNIESKKIFEEKWLDIEPIYESLNWVVIYDSPCWADNPYPATFTFKKKRKI